MAEEEKKQTLITDVPEAKPANDGDEAKSGSASAKSKAKSKGKGKGKKPTKKELARRRREKAEQERQEQLRREKELEEKRIREQEMEMERRERERLQDETNDLDNLRKLRHNQNVRVREEQAKKEEWERYLSCNHSTNPRDTADVNTFVSTWQEVDDTDMNELFGKIGEANKLVDELLALKSQAGVEENPADAAKYARHIEDVRKVIQAKIERLTVHQLLFSEKFASSKNEVLLSAEGGGYGYGLWVNLAKNPRISSIDFGNVGMEIYKTIAQAAIAIRVTTSPILHEFGKYVLLSPVLTCEFFQLPPPTKRVGGMTLRQVSTQHNLQTVQYPLKTTRPNEVQPPIGFRMKIDPSLLPENCESLTVIKIDDIENTETQISDVEIDKEEGVFKFKSATTGVFALAMPRYAHFPFKFWEVNSLKEDSCEIFIRTSLTEFSLNVDSNGLCSMEAPISFSGLTPPAALELMQRRGLNIIAPDSNSEFVEETASQLSEKQPELETALANGISDAVTGFRIRISRWNSQVPGDRAMLLVREIGEFGDPVSGDEQNEEETRHEHNPEEEERPDKTPENQTRWHAVLAKAKHMNEVRYSENAAEPSSTVKDKSIFHQHLLPLFMDMASSAVQGRTRNCSGFVSETVRFILQKAKLFSSTL